MDTAHALTHSVEAYNLSHASENKIHDDSVAQKLGFSGGLVPGVEIFAYASNPMVARFGAAFLERGKLSCRFLKPVYDGHTATVTAKPEGDGFAITVESDGTVCATGQGALPADAPAAPAITSYAESFPPEDRPPASPESLAVGTALGIRPDVLTQAQLDSYLSDVRETLSLYSQTKVAHPGLLLRLCNLALKDNVALPPWVHTGSTVQYFSTAKVGDTLSVRARVADNYERKGHRLVDLDCLIVADGERPVAHVLHTAIYQLRHLAD